MTSPWDGILEAGWKLPATPGVRQHEWVKVNDPVKGRHMVCPNCGFVSDCKDPGKVFVVEGVRNAIRKMASDKGIRLAAAVLVEDCDKTRENLVRSVLET